MRRLHTYVFMEMLGPTIVGLLAYGLILLMNLSLQVAEMAIRRDLPISLVGNFILLAIPQILVLATPMAVLLGILIGMGRLASDNEIAALRALGLNERRLIVPAATFGLIAAGFTFLIYDAAVPAANYEQHQLQARIFLSTDLNREIQPRAFYEKIPDLLIYADTASPADGTLQEVLLYQKRPDGTEEVSSADRARVEYREVTGALNFRLEDVVSHSWNRTTPDIYQVAQRDEETIVRPPDVLTTELLRSLKEPPPRNLREQSFSQLRSTIAEFRKQPKGVTRKRFMNEARVELHKKFAIPATCLVFAILGLAVALPQRRGGKAVGFLTSLLVIALQYFMITAGEQLADRGRMSAWAAMWMGNIVFGSLAIVLLLAGRRWSWSAPALFTRRRSRRAGSAAAAAESPVSVPPPLETGRRAGVVGSEPTEPPPNPPARSIFRFPGGRWLPRIDRYLLRTLLPVTVLVVLSLSLLFALFASLDLIDDLTRSGQPISLLFQYVANVLPNFVTNFVLPLGLCASTLITFALLSRSQELTALRSAGLGPFRVSAAFLLVGCLSAALSYGALDSVLPATNQKATQVRDQIRGRTPRSYRQPERRWIFGSRSDLVTFSGLSRERGEMLDLGVFRFKPRTFSIVQRISAERADWTPEGWILSNGWQRDFDEEGHETFTPFARKRIQDLDGPDYFSQEWKAPDQMNIRDLRAYVSDMERRGHDTRDLRVGLHRKVAVPAVCIVMVLIALPFGLRTERRGALFGLGVALFLAAVYYFVMQATGKLGEIGLLPPVLAAWAPNMAFSGAGLYLMAWSRW